jgi:outer membrane protein insertion porin family
MFLRVASKGIRKSLQALYVVLCAFFLTFSFCVLQSAADPTPPIQVKGVQRVDPAFVRSYFTSRGYSVPEAQRALLATGLFDRVEVHPEGMGIEVVVIENPIINRVAFEGNSKISSENLQQAVDSKKGNPFHPTILARDIARLKEAYKMAGRTAAQVSGRPVSLGEGRVDVVFTIDEGNKTGVKTIKFLGNKAYSSSRLRGLMSTTEMNFLSWFKSSDIYEKTRLEKDVKEIERFYMSRGYADFRVVSTDVTFDSVQNGYNIVITVSEGEPYRLGSSSVRSSIAAVNTDLFKSALSDLKAGSVYDVRRVENAIKIMMNTLMENGYSFAQVRPEVSRNSADHRLGITYVIEEGPRVYVERIHVHGNTRTRDYVIRRAFDVNEGDAYNPILVKVAEQRLNNLGFFKTVKITGHQGSAPDRLIIDVEVTEQPTGQLSASLGYSTVEKLLGEIGISETNFMGKGQYIRLSGTLGNYSNGVNFSFTDPYFFGNQFSLGTDLYYSYSNNTNYAYYNNTTVGGRVRVGYPVSENFGITPYYSGYVEELNVPNTLKKPYSDCTKPLPGMPTVTAYPACIQNGEASLAIKEADGQRTFVSLVGTKFVYSTLDNMRNPHTGVFAQLAPEVSGLGGNSKFFRVTGDASYYTELLDDVVGFAKIQGGYIVPYAGTNLRILDNFFLGPELVRGFQPRGIGPRDQNVDSAYNALGGSMYIGGTLEVQFPLGLPPEIGLRGAVFTDAGTLSKFRGRTAFPPYPGAPANCPGAPNFNPNLVSDCINVNNETALRSSVGASLIWNSPVGPLRFDFSQVLSKAPGDRTQLFQFSGGTSF